MTKTNHRVGEEIRGLCPTCKQPQLHVVSTITNAKIAQVQCKVCGTSHKHRPVTKPKTKRQDTVEAVSPEATWNKLMAGAASKKSVDYTFQKQYQVTDLIKHETFGLGVVMKMTSPTKMQVAFKEGELLLICNTN